MFQIGDKIVHPLHGAAIIKNIVKEEILGRISEYYVLNLYLKKMEIKVPVDRCEAIGIRKVINMEQIDKVCNLFRDDTTVSEDNYRNWTQRFRDNMDQIKTGDVFKVAEVVKKLKYKEKQKGLSMGERRMLESIKQNLVGEFACSKGIDFGQASIMLEKALLH